MSVASARMRIKGETKDLMVNWKRAGDSWRDAVSAAFEANQLVPLEKRVRATMSAMEKIEAHLIRARRECGDD